MNIRPIRVILPGLIFFAGTAFSLTITNVEPPNWWEDMETDTVSILVYGDDFSGYSAESTGRTTEILHQYQYKNPAYYHLTMKIHSAGTEEIVFRKNREKTVISFPVFERKSKRPRPIDTRDIIYLVMPDRFADGDTSRNTIEGHQDPIRPDHPWGRRGGDLEGIRQNLDYFEELGITVLWMTPVFENNYINCYHGYTPTDLYAIDPHLGDFETYQTLITEGQSRGIKFIMDHITNHISPSHPLAVDPPSPAWINYSVDDFEPCNYRISDVIDPWASDSLRELVQSGWFAGYLADMNLRHKPVVDYWITHTIWWIERFGLDGIRQDTWPYSDTEGAKKWVAGVRKEYPEIFILAETMVFEKTPLSYFFSSRPDLDNGLSSVTDFAHSSLIYQLTTGRIDVETFHSQLSLDFIYREPLMMTVFMDNHDMGRFFSDTGENIQTYLNAFTLIYGLRGIPQVYYGDEIGMTGGHDPENRNEFPGGFLYHTRSAFTAEGRTERENLLFNQFKTFNRLRLDHPSLFQQPFRHFMPDSTIYGALRKDGDKALLVLYNHGTEQVTIPLSSYFRKEPLQCELITPLHASNSVKIHRNHAVIPKKTAAMWLITFTK